MKPSRDRGFLIALFFVFLTVAIAGQVASGTLLRDSETAHYPDEPSHVITSLMIHDYVTAGFPDTPLRYAETYYLHYPKVAFGIWPPVFHITAAIWMFLFGANKTALLLLIAAQTAALATTLCWFARRLFGTIAAVGIGLLFLAIPLVQYCTTMVMLDAMVGLLEFWSMLSLLRFFRTRKMGDGVLFGLLTAGAMLTKGNANALVLMVPILIVLTGQWNILLSRGLYAAAAMIVLIGGPWQLWSWRIIQGTVPISHLNAGHLASTLLIYLGYLVHAFGWALLIPAAVGFAIGISGLARKPALWEQNLPIAGVLSLVLAVIVFQTIAPVPADERYMFPVAAPLLILFAEGIRALAALPWLPVPAYIRAMALGGVCLSVFAAGTFSIPKRGSLGYSRIADLLRDPRFAGKISLVCSDSNGEGALIAAIALGEERPGRFVLRGSKVLSENEWDATTYRPFFLTPQQLLAYLDSVPVDAVVIDWSEPTWKADRDILANALVSAPDRWQRTNDIPVGQFSRHIALYRRIKGDAYTGNHPNLKLNMRFTLGRTLTLQ